jgi:Zn-dependent peptidase ImmA (M78 family)
MEDERAIEELAKKYKVSLQALVWRISNLFSAA